MGDLNIDRGQASPAAATHPTNKDRHTSFCYMQRCSYVENAKRSFLLKSKWNCTTSGEAVLSFVTHLSLLTKILSLVRKIAKITEHTDPIGHPERVSAVVQNECEWQGRGERRERGKEIRSAMLRREKEGTFDT